MFGAIRHALGTNRAANVFLATDDPAFSAALKEEMPQLSLTSYDRGQTPTGVARHFSDLAPDDKALEALVNIFLIARA